MVLDNICRDVMLRIVEGGQLDFGFQTPRRQRRKKPGPRKSSTRVPHVPREVDPRQPLHVTVRMRPEVWNLRSRRCFGVLERAFYLCLERRAARFAHFSVQGKHVHMLVEASGVSALARMMQSFCIRSAKGLNKVMRRPRGTVFGDRYHSRSLKTPTQTRATLVYVLQNARKHLLELGHLLPRDWLDLYYSSAGHFTGWDHPPPAPPRPPPVAPPQTWLLSTGWRERGGGPIRRAEIPRAKIDH